MGKHETDEEMEMRLRKNLSVVERRRDNIKFFKDTMKFNNELPSLKKAIYDSIENTAISTATKSYNVTRSWKNVKNDDVKGIIINDMTTIDAALELDKRLRGSEFQYRIGILNFASATTVGGGTTVGANTQEESICRVSTLYPVLNSEKVHDGYYLKNRICGSRLYEDICVYSPDIIIFRKDGMNPLETLPEVEWAKVDVLTCPAPNLRRDKHNRFNPNDNDGIVDVDEKKLREVLANRIKLILYTAAKYGITHIVLGAFGCGSFKNPPDVVADVFHQILIDNWMNLFFMEVIFAIPYNQYDKINHDTFVGTFSDYFLDKQIKQVASDAASKFTEHMNEFMCSLF